MSCDPAWPCLDTCPYLRDYDAISWTCWHLVVAFYARELSIALPRYDAIAAAQRSGDWREVVGRAEIVAAHRARDWSAVASLTAFGDVLTFGARHDGHVGVAIRRLVMLHVAEDRYTREQRYDAPGWAPTLTGVWRWKRKPNP